MRSFVFSALAFGLLCTAASAGPFDPPAPPSDVRYFCHVRWDETHQVIDGFGISAAFHQAQNLRNLPEAEQREVLDLLFSPTKGAGFSMVRNIIGDGGEIAPGKTWGEPKNGPTPSIEPQEGVWNWTGDEEQIWFMREAQNRGCDRFMSTSWSPPAWMKTNHSVIEGGELRPDKYKAFANYLVAYVQGYKKEHGIDLYAISPQNEPDQNVKYSSCLWTGEQYRDFLKTALIPAMKQAGLKTKLILGEHSEWNDTIVLPSLRDPDVAPSVDIVAAHAYVKDNLSLPPQMSRSGTFVEPTRLGKHIWQTEVSAFDSNDPRIGDGIYWAKLIHTHLVDANVSGWFYWWAVAYMHSKSSLINLDLDRKIWTTSKRLYSIGNYARFVRPGFVRVEADASPAPDVFVSAYVDPTSGRKVIVAINDNPAPCPLDFLGIASGGEIVSTYRTSDRENLGAVSGEKLHDRDLETVLRPRSVTTFVLDASRNDHTSK